MLLILHLLLFEHHISVLLLDLMLLLLLLLLLVHCSSLLCVLNRAAPASKFDTNLIRDLDLSRVLLGCSCREVRSLGQSCLRWEAGHSCFDCGLRLVHLKRWHSHVVLVLLAHLQGLFQDVLVADNAHIRVVLMMLLVVIHYILLSLILIHSHLLDHVG